VRFKT